MVGSATVFEFVDAKAPDFNTFQQGVVRKQQTRSTNNGILDDARRGRSSDSMQIQQFRSILRSLFLSAPVARSFFVRSLLNWLTGHTGRETVAARTVATGRFGRVANYSIGPGEI